MPPLAYQPGAPLVARRSFVFGGRTYHPGDALEGLSETAAGRMIRGRFATQNLDAVRYEAVKPFTINGGAVAVGDRVDVSEMPARRVRQLTERRMIAPVGSIVAPAGERVTAAEPEPDPDAEMVEFEATRGERVTVTEPNSATPETAAKEAKADQSEPKPEKSAPAPKPNKKAKKRKGAARGG